MKESQRQPKSDAKESKWQKTPFANLVRYVPSGVYFARVRVGGKLIRKSLKTRSKGVAKIKLADLEKEEREKLESSACFEGEEITFKDLLKEYRDRLDRDRSIKPRTRDYREECIKRILKAWPELPSMDARKIRKEDCEKWAARLGASPSSYNNTIATLRYILQIAVEKGARYSNPAEGIKRVRVRAKKLELPSQEQFHAIVEEIRKVPFGPGLASADLVEFLAYGGFRKSEVKYITWEDCDFSEEKIWVRGHPETGTKNGEVRWVPMIPDMVRLLRRLRQARPAEDSGVLVMRVFGCHGALARACKSLGIPRITHHDLRHLFATRCIETTVDIPTVSRWLGHKDGGALAMKVYGHLRDQHSVAMAKKVTFSTSNGDQPEEAA